MRVDVRPFDRVFDGTANFVARAVLDLDRAPVPLVDQMMRDDATEGEDGLDTFWAVPLVLTTDAGEERRFALWHHRHNPPAQVAIHLPLGEEFQDALAGIMTTLQIPAAALVWLDQPIGPGRVP